MNYPSVSILTVTQEVRRSYLNILYDNIQNQTYKNISEWLIVDSSNGEYIKNFKNSRFEVKHINVNIADNLGLLRNKGNMMATSEIIVRMDDDDYFFPSYIDHCVNKLLKSNKHVAGCSTFYIHDLLNYKTYKQNISMTVLAYRREYLTNHKYDETSN